MVMQRKIRLTDLAVNSTFAGCLEGTPETNSQHIMEDLEHSLKQKQHRDMGLAIIRPAEFPLPGYRFVGTFLSPQAINLEDLEMGSRLQVCWFDDNLDQSINEMVQVALSQVNWEAAAMNYDIYDI